MFRILTTALALYMPIAPAWAATYLVAPKRSLSGSGTVADPFGSIAACLAAALSGDTCLLRNGIYRETAVPASGVTIRAVTPFAATIDGSDPVRGWRRESGDLWSAPLAPAANLPALQLFSPGMTYYQARWPNASADPTLTNWSIMAAGTTTGVIVDPNLPAIDWTGATVHMFSGDFPYAHNTALVVASAPGQLTIQTADPNCPGFCAEPGGRYYVFGAKGAIDTPGEWFFDGTRLYLQVQPGGDPRRQRVTAKARTLAVDLSTASNVTVRDVDINAASIATGPGTTNDTVANIRATFIDSLDRLDGPGSGGANVIGSYVGSSGIILRGGGHTLRDSVVDTTDGNGVLVDGDNITVTNTLFRDNALLGTYVTPIALNGGNNDVITHNTVDGAIGFGITGPLAQSTLAGNSIAFNNVVGTMRQRTDGGSLYFCCSGVQTAGLSIDHNWVHDDVATGYFGPAIYLDNGVGGALVTQNVAACVGAVAFYLNGVGDLRFTARGNTLTNNTGLVGSGSLTAYNQLALTLLNNQFDPNTSNLVGAIRYAKPPRNNVPTAPGATDLLPDPAQAGVGCAFQGCQGSSPAGRR